MEKLTTAWSFAQNVHHKFTKGYPMDPFEPAELQKKTVENSYKTKFKKGVFAIMESKEEMSVVHVVVDSQKLSKSFSIYRAPEMDVAMKVLERFYEEKTILGLIETDALFFEMVNLIHTHVDWKSIHFVASTDLQLYFDPFREEDYENCVDLQTPLEGLTPLHLAVMNDHRKTTVAKLISLGADLSKTDAKGQNVFHHAARTNGKMIKSLASASSSDIILSLVNATNGNGLTPLFIALSNEEGRDDVMTALLELGADPRIRCGVPEKKSFFPELMIRIKDPKNTSVMKQLLDIDPTLVNDYDHDTGETAFHYCKDKKSLMILIDSAGFSCNMNIQNKEGQTPLHQFANRGDLASCVQILACGADPNIQDNDGNTALHLEVMAKINSLSPVKVDPILVRLLLVFGADPFIKNNKNENVRDLLVNSKSRKLEDLLSSINVCFTEEQPADSLANHDPPTLGSHAFTEHAHKQRINRIKKLKQDLGLTMKELIASGEVPEAPKGGFNPFAACSNVNHCAEVIESANPPPRPPPPKPKRPPRPTRAATLGNDADIPKTSPARITRKSPLDAPGSDNEEITEGVAVPNPIKTGKAWSGSPKLPKIIHCLSMDGGGIRGLVLTQILMYIERKLGRRLVDCFHWIGGTSIGAIMAMYLALGHSVTECQCLLFRFKDVVFKETLRPYNTSVLEGYLQTAFREETCMSDINAVRVMVAASVANENPPRLDLFRNYNLPINDSKINEELGYYDPETLPVWKIARCTSAAPSYFATMEFGENTYLDGGLIANNPSMELLSDVQSYNDALIYENRADETVTVGCLLSIGTGVIPKQSINHRWDLQLPENPWDMVLKGIAVKDFANLLIDQVCATEGTPVARTRSWCHSTQTPFFRFSAPLSNNLPLDTKEDRLVIQMCWETFEYMQRHKDEVDELVDFLTT